MTNYRSVNALAEKLWMLIKTECIRGRTFDTRAEANLALFEYIDGFYNPHLSSQLIVSTGALIPQTIDALTPAGQATAMTCHEGTGDFGLRLADLVL